MDISEIGGWVTDISSGQKLKDVTVWVVAQGPAPITPGDGSFPQLTTDQNGYYQTPEITPQLYAVSAIKSGYWTQTKNVMLMPIGGPFGGPNYVSFRLEIAEPLTVTGMVSASGGPRLIGAVVTLDIGLQTTTDRNGEYKLTYDGESTGSHTVTAAYPGFMSTSRSFNVANGGPVTENLVLFQLGSLSGTVKETTGKPIPGATVAAGTVSTRSDLMTGTYSLPGLDPVQIDVTASAPDFDLKQIPVTIPAGKNLVLDIPLTEGSATLTGTVTSAGDGTPVPASVAVSGFNTTNTDGTGRYTLTGVPAGSHLVTASAVRFFRPQSATVSVAAHETLEQDFLLEPSRTSQPG
jgi:hypothetical protein